MDSQFPKTCSKCAREISRDEWYTLEYVGLQEIDGVTALELRNHDCGSTISVVVGLTEEN